MPTDRQITIKEDSRHNVSEFLQSYFLCPEAIQLYAIVAGFLYLRHRAGGVGIPKGKVLLKAMKDHSYVWLPQVTTLVVNSLGNYLGRCRENREVARQQNTQHDTRLQQEMETHRQAGETAMGRRQYHLAMNNFHAACEIYYHIYAQDSRVRAKQLYLDCIYKECLSLYCLKRSKEAKTLLSSVLVNPHYQDGLHERVLLLNLRALINFQEGHLPENRAEEGDSVLWDEAKSDFETSFKLDSSQNSIYLFLQYLSRNYQFLADNIPNYIFKPKVNLSSNASGIMQDDVLNICADACVKVKNWAKAILLYEDRLNAIKPNPNTYFELAHLTLKAFYAYKGLIDAHPASEQEVTILGIVLTDLEDGKSPEPQLIDKVIPIAELKKQAAQKVVQVKVYLDAELFYITDNIKLARTHINHGLLYNQLSELTNELDYGAELPRTDSLKEQALDQFRKAQEALARNQCSEANILLKMVERNIEALESKTTTLTL